MFLVEEAQLKMYRFHAIRPDGERDRGEVEASSQDEALKLLRRRNLVPIDIREQGDKVAMFDGLFSGPLSLTFYSRFCRAFADLLGAGIPVREALRLLQEHERPGKTRQFIERLDSRVSAGNALSSSLMMDQTKPPQLMSALFMAGESAGTLSECVGEAADLLEGIVQFRRELVSQIAYPVFLILLVVATLFFMSFVILPQFEGLFEGAKGDAPEITLAMIVLGSLIRDFGPLLLIGGLLVLLIGRIAARRRPVYVDGAIVRLPIVGKMVAKSNYALFCNCLGGLAHGNVPMSTSFNVAKEAVGNQRIAADLDLTERALREGGSLSDSLAQHAFVPHEVLALVSIGEQTGDLPKMLVNAAQVCEDQVKMTQKRLMAILGPALVIVMGGIIALVVGAVMVGILSLNEMAVL